MNITTQLQQQPIAVIGATGKTGKRVTHLLTQAGIQVRPLTRQTQPRFDWHQPHLWAESLRGCRAVYITYQPDLAVPEAQGHIRELVKVALANEVEHLVLLSGRGEAGAQAAEQEIINSGLRWNVVRASWFMQNFSESFMAEGIQQRRLVLPQAKASEPFIDVDDIAEVAVAALLRAELSNRVLEITGPELLSFHQCVALISNGLQEPVTLQEVPLETYLAQTEKDGLPPELAWLMNELFGVVLDGRNEKPTDTIEKVLGRKPRDFHNYVVQCVKNNNW